MSTSDSSPDELMPTSDSPDELMLTYLDTIDTYQTQRAALSAALSRGFLSLAQANFTTPGRRFGQDFYDGRMSAQRGVEATAAADGAVTFRVRKIPADPETRKDDPAPKPDPRDPLRWFGILVPPALRATQSEFAASVDAAIPQLLTTLSALTCLEARVARARTRHVYKVLAHAPPTPPLPLDDGDLCTAAQVPGVAAASAGAGAAVWLLKIPVRGRLRWEGALGVPRLCGAVEAAEAEVREFRCGGEGWGAVFEADGWVED